MTSKYLAAGAVALLAIAGVALVTGVGPLPGGADAGGDDVTTFPTGTATTTDGGSTAGTTSTATTTTTTRDGSGDGGGSTDGTTTAPTTTTTDSPFGFAIDRVEKCGTTCRDVTVTLTNRQGTAATGVEVRTRIFAGNGTDGERIWRGTETVGTLDAGASHTATKRVDLSYSEALAVQGEDGWITVETTIVTDDRTITVTERRDVT